MEKKEGKELSIIIVNYNGEKYLKDCLNSVYDKCASIDFEIIIIDNNSTDNSVSFIKENYSKVQLIESKENLGFAKGNNKAIRKSCGTHILLLNNDTILLDDIAPAIKTLKIDTTIGAVGIKMLDGTANYIPSVGKFPKALSLIKFSNLEEKRQEFKTGNFTKNQLEVDWCTGAFLVTKRTYWDQVKGLDEDYFMYVEDVDFCKKIKNIGKKTVFLSNLKFTHFVGFNSKREIRLIKGYKIYSSKHFNFINTILAHTCLSINYAYKKVFKNIC